MKTKRPTRGRRRFKTKLASSVDASLPAGAPPTVQWLLDNRKELSRYLPDPAQFPPITFADTANNYLLLQRQFPPGLRKQLQWHEHLNATTCGDFNAVELSPELLRQAITSNPCMV